MMSRIGQELETWEMQKGKLKIKVCGTALLSTFGSKMTPNDDDEYNEMVEEKMGCKRELVTGIGQRKMTFAGHVLRGSSGELANLVLEGTIDGKRDRGKQRKTWSDDIFNSSARKYVNMGYILRLVISITVMPETYVEYLTNSYFYIHQKNGPCILHYNFSSLLVLKGKLKSDVDLQMTFLFPYMVISHESASFEHNWVWGTTPFKYQFKSCNDVINLMSVKTRLREIRRKKIAELMSGYVWQIGVECAKIIIMPVMYFMKRSNLVEISGSTNCHSKNSKKYLKFSDAIMLYLSSFGLVAQIVNSSNTL
ncbi:hypothetical protein GQR58_007627 [Nymphon striatum]|nr:hypothetical protein GQR58_007627 [Nymphon striatum]